MVFFKPRFASLFIYGASIKMANFLNTEDNKFVKLEFIFNIPCILEPGKNMVVYSFSSTNSYILIYSPDVA